MGNEGVPTVNIDAPEIGQLVNPVQAGIEWLTDKGIGIEVAGMVMVGPRKGCDGTLAAMMGVQEEAHDQFRANVERVVNRAIKAGKDPNEALVASMDAFFLRDDKDEIVTVSPEDLKKNGEAAGN